MAIIEARRGPTLKPRVNVSRPSSGAQDRVAFNAALMEGIPSSATHMGIDHDEAGRRLKFYPVTGEDYGGSPAHKLLPDGGKKRESGARIVLVRRPDLAFLVPGRYEPHGIGTLAGGGFEIRYGESAEATSAASRPGDASDLVHEAKRAPQAEATSAASRPGGASDLVHEAKRGQRAARQRETPKPRKGRRKK